MVALPTIDFGQIRAHDGSQDRAFEELGFQLLRDLTDVPADAVIVRHGTPDGGVEFLVELPEGGKWGWQAKYLFRLDGGALSQLDASVERALSSHPELTRFTFCLPYNRPAGTEKGKKSATKKWRDRVQKWSSWARERGMDVEFAYVGESELLEALAKEHHAGRVRYWFGQDVLTRPGLEAKLAETLAAVGPRYTRELHVDLPIAEVFDGLCRSPRFHERLRRKLRAVRESQKYWGEGRKLIADDDQAEELYQSLLSLLADVDRQVLDLDLSSPERVDLPRLVSSCRSARDRSTELWRHLDAIEEKARQARRETQESSRSSSYFDAFKSIRWFILKLEDALRELEALASSDAALAVNSRALLLLGEAGAGKTHLLSDVVRQQIADGHAAILLLGQHFGSGDLWQQILQQADFDGRPDEFLGALEAAAQASGGQALLCIDALNEAGDLRLWEKHLPLLLERIRLHPRVSVALSCRTGYEEEFLPADRSSDRIVRVQHHGFASKTQEAVRTYFRHYGLTEPAFPLTLPEIGNPLFLRLMCISLSGQSVAGLPRGLTAVTSLFAGFLQEVERRLSRRCDYPAARGLVREAVEMFAQDMLESDQEWVSFKRAEEVTQKLLPRSGWSGSLLNGLIDEGVLLRDRTPPALDLGTKEVVRFAYQRLGDHLCAERLCAEGLEGVRRWLEAEPEELRSRMYFRGGLFKALAIQLPEQFGVELHDLVSDRSLRALQDAFLQSLIWRAPETIQIEHCFPYLREISRERDTSYHAPTLDAFLQVAVIPGHPFNAEFLHDQLARRSMPQRDAFWSIYVHQNGDEESPLGRLISWSEAGDASKLSGEAALLTAHALVWCFSTSNREVRDRATKALVALLRAKLELAEQLLDRFGDIEDPYVVERLYAAIYGAVLACQEPETAGGIARRVYSQLFEGGAPTVHVLIRDCASGIVEWALELCGELDGVDPALVRPPYASPWPCRAPKLRKEFREKDSYSSIVFSVMSWDFNKYIIRPAVWRFLAPNQPRRRSEERARRRREAQEQQDALERSLKPQQIKLLNKADGQAAPQRALAAFHRSLDNEQSSQLTSAMIAQHSADQPVGAVRFDPELASRWIANRVVALGWRPGLFLEFDKSVKSSERHAPGAERMGKKYQWIAFHELVARLADHCEFEPWDEDTRLVEGLWELEQRDIDPTFGLEPDEKEPSWMPLELLSERIDDDEAWVRTLRDCASVKNLIDLKGPDGRRWIAVEHYPEWREETPPEVGPSEVKYRRFWYQIRSYLIRLSDLKTFLDWAGEQRFYGRWMPESHIIDTGFLGEYPWHPSTLAAQQDWTQEGRLSGDLPVPLLATGCLYSWSRSRDYSVKDSPNGLLPNGPLLQALQGRWSGSGLRFVDRGGRVVAWDPSGGRRDAASPSCLLVDADALREYLGQHELTVVWTILGEKIVHPGGLGVPERYVRGDVSGSLFLEGGEIRMHSLRLYGRDPKGEESYVVVDSLSAELED